ncbi:MAG: hypothetical protein ABI616_15540 [Pseudomonadota bacterium]
MTQALHTAISGELGRATPAAVTALAENLARRGSGATAAVLYYGSTLRADALDGMLDFYVLLDNVGAWPGSPLAKLANRVLPPNVGYVEFNFQGQVLRAKYAVMSVVQFRSRLGRLSLDTTIWARFCQPVMCPWSRSPRDRDETVNLVSSAVASAARWAVELGPQTAVAEDFWRALFARTYAAELRIEKSGRPQDIVGNAADRYTALLPLALDAAQIRFNLEAGMLTPALDADHRERAQRSWKLRERLGRPLNILRLLKAAFTFEGAMDYVVWKIERHRGVRIEVSPWQRRFPLLAAPGLYWQLRRRGIIR